MKKLVLPPPTSKSAKDFLLMGLPLNFQIWEIPQKILGFNSENVARQKIYSWSEETATKKIEMLKKWLDQW